MTKCTICGPDKDSNDTEWIWQPFGPDESANCFMVPGNHYRGFPAIRICDFHKRQFQRGHDFIFRYRYRLYKAVNRQVSTDLTITEQAKVAVHPPLEEDKAGKGGGSD